MPIQWMTVEVNFSQVSSKWQLAIDEIEVELRKLGKVYSWLVTDVDTQQQKVFVDAIIQRNAD
jgi:hypothetical protein